MVVRDAVDATADTYAYYADGTRRAAGGKRHYYAGDQELDEYDDPWPLAGGDETLERRYVRLPGPSPRRSGFGRAGGFTDMAFLMIDYTGACGSAGCEYWAMSDARGSAIVTTDETGAVRKKFAYSAYGKTSAASSDFPFLYTGQKFDATTGLYFYKARYYSPELGRFMQNDPIGYGDGMNMYGYVGGDPVNFTDPNGLAGQGMTLGWNTVYADANCGLGNPCPSFGVYRAGRFYGGGGGGGGGRGGSSSGGTSESKIDNSFVNNIDKSAFFALAGSFDAALGLGSAAGGFSGLDASKIANFGSTFGAAKSLITISNGIPYFETRDLAEDALINAIVAATRLTGNEHSSILFYDPNRAGQSLYAYSYTALNEGTRNSVSISGRLPVGARALASYHTHNVPSIPSGPLDIGRDSGLAGGSIPNYVVGLDGVPRIIRYSGYY